MIEEQELEDSGYSQDITRGGKTVRVEIYRLVGEPEWALEVVDEYNNSTVWQETFADDEAAFKEVKETIAADGIESLIGASSDNG